MVEFSEEELKKLREFFEYKEKQIKPLIEKPIKEKRTLTPISDWCKHYAVIFDDSGHYAGKVKMKYSNSTFSFNDFSYNFKPNETSFFKIKGFWGTKKYYAYNISNPDGLLLKSSGIEAVINSKTYKAILENKLVEELNDLAEGGFMAFLKKYWWLILIIVAGAIYFLTKGDTTGADVVNSTTTAIVKNVSFGGTR